MNTWSTIIENRLQELAEVSMVNGEIWRAVYTPEDAKSKELVSQWMDQAGLDVYEDSVGNLFGRLQGKNSEVILVGSHLDTVKNGGRYDGAAGILTAVEALRLAKEKKGAPEKTLEVVALAEEEGSRYGSSYLGSRAITGQLTFKDLEEKDNNGTSIREAMESAGYKPELFKEAVRKDLIAFIELHIEQGPVLDREKLQIGVVENIVGIISYDITVRGNQNHAGTTPMCMRRDPVLALSQMIGGMSKQVKEISETATFTVGKICARPGISNVIAGEVVLTIDLRDGHRDRLRRLDDLIQQSLRSLADGGFEVLPEKRCNEMPVALKREVSDIIEEAAQLTGKSYCRMNSGAGHDAQVFAASLPAGMIFIPSAGGISHSPDEFTTVEALCNGLEVLTETILRIGWC